MILKNVRRKMKNPMVKKAIIPAAGLGTRFLPITKALPKEMLPIIDKPVIQYIVDEAIEAGIEEIIIIINENKSMIQEYFNPSLPLEHRLEKQGKTKLIKVLKEIPNSVKIHFVNQKEQLGLGHALLSAESLIGDEPFAVLLGDELIENGCLSEMINTYHHFQTPIIGAMEVNWNVVHKYGIISTESLESPFPVIENLVEKPLKEDAPSNLAIIGRYILQPDIFNILKKQKPGVAGEIQLTDALNTVNNGSRMRAYILNGHRFDVGSQLGYLIANLEYAMNRKDLSSDLQEYMMKRFLKKSSLHTVFTQKGLSTHV
jgi:UTP--glucose-1-phosphate uridylyltransferase